MFIKQGDESFVFKLKHDYSDSEADMKLGQLRELLRTCQGISSCYQGIFECEVMLDSL